MKLKPEDQALVTKHVGPFFANDPPTWLGPLLSAAREEGRAPASGDLREKVHQIVALCANASGWIAGTAEEKQAVLDGLIEEATGDLLNLIGGDGWKPIETAPKDGSAIDVWRPEGGRDTVYWGFPHHDCGEMGGLCDSDWHSIRSPGWVCSTFNEFLGRKHAPFTHWRPLPPPPVTP